MILAVNHTMNIFKTEEAQTTTHIQKRTSTLGDIFIVHHRTIQACVGRFASLMTKAIHSTNDLKVILLPKIVIVVPDDNLCNIFGVETSKNVSKAYCRILNYIMTEYERCVASFKENLPAKSVRSPGFPSFLWIQLPRHINFKNNSQRFKFNRCLEEQVKLHSDTYTLALKKVWDYDDTNLYTDRFTMSGLRSYWEAVDKTICYFNSVVLKKSDKRKAQQPSKGVGQGANYQKDKFRWKNPNINFHSVVLPLPPGFKQ